MMIAKFFMVKILGYYKKNTLKLICSSILSTIRPIPPIHQFSELPVPVPSETFETISKHEISIDFDDNSDKGENFQVDTTNATAMQVVSNISFLHNFLTLVNLKKSKIKN